MAAVGTTVYGSEYNAVQTKIKGVLGTGVDYAYGNYGYNVAMSSGVVVATALVTQLQWQNLADDINKAITHQTNANFTGYATISGLISYANLSTLNTYADNAITNRLIAAAGQLTNDGAIHSPTRAAAWSTNVKATGQVLWSSADDRRYFFNQGGYINFSGKAYATTPTIAQDLKWHQAMGYFSFNADYSVFSGLGATKPTGANYTLSNGTNANVFANPYNADYIAVRCWLSSATVMDYEIWYVDDHVGITGGPDNVSGGLGAYVNRVRASGAFTGIQPTTQNVVNFA